MIEGAMNMPFRIASAAGIVFLSTLLGGPAAAQDITKLRINEVMPSNKKTPPADLGGKFQDLLEIYNPTDAAVTIDGMIIANVIVNDGGIHPGDPPGSFAIAQGTIRAKGFVLIYCDGKGNVDANGNAHGTFKLAKDGEQVAIFTPAGEVIDLVAFPALGDDASFGRSPDGSDTLCPLLAPTFKEGPITTGGALDAQNAACGNLPPAINFQSLDSIGSAADVNPAAGAPVSIRADTTDDKAGGVTGVSAFFRVDGGAETQAALQVDSVDSGDPKLVHWKGIIPGQAAGSVVTFRLAAVDDGQLTGNDPDPLCGDPPTTDCKLLYRYTVGYVYQGTLVLNEVCPDNATLLVDAATGKFEDYLELYNQDLVNAVSLAGLWLSNSPFHPQDWQFPDDSMIAAGERLVVWCDKKESETDPSISDFHTSFNLGKSGDGVFLFDTADKSFGLIDGLKFGASGDDQAWSRLPDGERSSPFVLQIGTPGDFNGAPGNTFVRGDADKNGKVEIQDGMVVIEYLFDGGPTPACPDAADADDSAELDITDAIDILWSLFGAATLPQPFPNPAVDPTPDDLGCGGGT
jgi:lamin tail-like protein